MGRMRKPGLCVFSTDLHPGITPASYCLDVLKPRLQPQPGLRKQRAKALQTLVRVQPLYQRKNHFFYVSGQEHIQDFQRIGLFTRVFSLQVCACS